MVFSFGCFFLVLFSFNYLYGMPCAKGLSRAWPFSLCGNEPLGAGRIHSPLVRVYLRVFDYILFLFFLCFLKTVLFCWCRFVVVVYLAVFVCWVVICLRVSSGHRQSKGREKGDDLGFIEMMNSCRRCWCARVWFCFFFFLT